MGQENDKYSLLYNELWLLKNCDNNSNLNTINVKVEKAEDVRKTTGAMEVSMQTQETKIANIAVPSLSSDVLISNWNTLVDKVNNCQECKLCYGRKNVVIERGNRLAKWMFVGEGPGEQEDIQGKPFVGNAGQLLDKMIAAMQLDRIEDVYICNVVKCRPPANRNPEPDEISHCQNYLLSQIALVKPQIIITLGRFAAQTLLNSEITVGKLRKIVHHYQNIPLIVTYHPAYLLRNPSAKKDSWEDLQLAMATVKDML